MKIIRFFLLGVPLFLTTQLHATSYYPYTGEPAHPQNEEVMKVGAKVHMFYSGAQDATTTVKINDVLIVYRAFGSADSATESGKIKVVATMGAYYLEGEVIEGYAEPGYLAMKGTFACLITSRLKVKQ